MALPALATSSDLIARAPGEVTWDQSRAQAVLDDASAWCRHVAGTTWTDDQDQLAEVPDIVVAIVCAVALRVLTNPEGYTSQAIGDWSGSLANASIDTYFTAQERKVLATYRPAGETGGLWALPIARRDLPVDDTEYIAVDPTGEPVPWIDTRW